MLFRISSTTPPLLDSVPKDTPWNYWIGGVVAPLCVAAFSIHYFVTRTVTIPLGSHGSNYDVTLIGSGAIATGLFFVFLALLLHFHFFWGNSKNETLNRHAEDGKIISLACLLLSFLYIAYRVFATGLGS